MAKTKTKNASADADVAAIWERIKADPTSEGAATDVRALVNAVRFARAGLHKVISSSHVYTTRCSPENDETVVTDRVDEERCATGYDVPICADYCQGRIAHLALASVEQILAGELVAPS